jgi:type I restriction enzyme S subunit
MVFPIDETIKNNETQSRTLASIRDALLPKLLSGEIRVKDAERFVESVV